MTSFQDTIKAIPGLTHYYPLDDVGRARDVIGNIDGVAHGNVTFAADGAHFDGRSWIELADSPDFSVPTTKELTIIAFLTVDDWKRVSNNNEYLHWMGKGRPNAHEWTFRTYIDGGGGEAPARKRRISFYNFVPNGGLGTGSYVQDPHAAEHVEQVIGGVATTKGSGPTPGYSAIYCNGVQRDKDMFTSYKTVPANTSTPVCIGTRGDSTGFLVGRIRRVAFFNRVLTDAELKRIYDAHAAEERTPEVVTPPVVTPPVTPPPVHPTVPDTTLAAAAIRTEAQALRAQAARLEEIANTVEG
jgi:hypothetical protein